MDATPAPDRGLGELRDGSTGSNGSSSRPRAVGFPATPVRCCQHGVGNETGLHGHFIANVTILMSEIFNELGLGVSLADFEFGVHRHFILDEDKAKAKKKRKSFIPDVIMVEDKSHHIRIVGEIKTWWTFKPGGNENYETFLASKLGMISFSF
jgi:hypothetical protein